VLDEQPASPTILKPGKTKKRSKHRHERRTVEPDDVVKIVDDDDGAEW
jgi:hypothetical protein